MNTQTVYDVVAEWFNNSERSLFDLIFMLGLDPNMPVIELRAAVAP